MQNPGGRRQSRPVTLEKGTDTHRNQPLDVILLQSAAHVPHILVQRKSSGLDN